MWVGVTQASSVMTDHCLCLLGLLWPNTADPLRRDSLPTALDLDATIRVPAVSVSGEGLLLGSQVVSSCGALPHGRSRELSVSLTGVLVLHEGSVLCHHLGR